MITLYLLIPIYFFQYGHLIEWITLMRSQMQEKSFGSSVAPIFRNIEANYKLSVDKYDFLFLSKYAVWKQNVADVHQELWLKIVLFWHFHLVLYLYIFEVSGVWYLICFSLFSLRIYSFMSLCLGENLLQYVVRNQYMVILGWVLFSHSFLLLCQSSFVIIR